MVVKRNFDRLYRTEEDPWNIGAADSARYREYLELLKRHAPAGGFARALDLGCGKGAFTAQLATLAREVTGVEISEIAVSKARAEFPRVIFRQGDARCLRDLDLPRQGFDLIVSSDLIYYLTPREAVTLLEEIARILSPEGRLFLAAWAPGGRYYTPEYLEDLVVRRFALLRSRVLPSHHATFLARPRRRDLVLTVDYETWQPVPPGKRVDWQETVLRPAEKLMLTAERFAAPITFFVEMGELLWLRRHDAEVAQALEEQIREARSRGHDIQLHLHPEWLPESNPTLNPATGEWWWDEGRNRVHLLEESPERLFRRLKEELERIVRPVDPAYQVRAFRAGKYRVQPHAALLRAMREAGILADSSVWQGGRSFVDRFDFRGACQSQTPYFPSPADINLPAPPAEETLLELPILSRNGKRFTLDGADARTLLSRFDGARERDRLSLFKERHPTAWRRISSRLRPFSYFSSRPRLDREPVPEFDRFGDETAVAIGHTKGSLRLGEIEHFLETLSARAEVRFRSVAQVVEERLAEREAHRATRSEMLETQVERESEAVLGEARNEAQSAHLQRKVPLDRRRVLDLGCGAGYWTKALQKRHGFCVGVDYGREFLEKARRAHQVSAARCDFHRLPFPEGAFDAVYADNVLEHSPDPSRLLREILRVLCRRGVLVAAVPPDARDFRFPVSDHLWKTDRNDLEGRLRKAGFTRIRLEEIDTARRFGMPAYPAAANAMLYLTAWKNDGEEYGDRERAQDLMEFVYRSLDPSKSQDSLDAEAILIGGHAWCLGYCAVLGELARREGIPARYVTLEAHDHPRGRGRRRADTHELVELLLGGRWTALDPMANRVLGAGVEEILARPELADRAAASRLPDERFRGRGYHLYCSSFFYERVVRFCRRESLTSGERWRWIPHRRAGGGASAAPRSVRRILLTDRPEAEATVPAGESDSLPIRSWTRADLLSGGGALSAARRIREIREDRLEIWSEDLAWHERIVRLHLLGALAAAPEKILMDRRGRKERLGWGPLLGRQIPEYLGGKMRAWGSIQRLRGILLYLGARERASPRLLPARRPPSVLYLRSDLWRGLIAGGSVGHVAGMAEAFRESGQTVSFLAADPPAGIDPERIPIHPVPPPTLIRVDRAAARFAHSFRIAREGILRFGADPPGLLYHRFDEGSIAGVLLARALGSPLVLEYNGSGVWIADHWDRPLPFRRTFQAIERVNLRHAHLIVAVSAALRDELIGKGVERGRILVCPNGVDPEIYRPDRDGESVRRRLGMEGGTVIGFIGTFGPWHGAPILARAAGAVARRLSDPRFLFVGEGPELGRVREIVVEEGIEARCRFTGLVPQEAAPDYLAACDILVSPHVPNPDGSRFFGSPTKLFEYMATGKAIVASDLEQIGEVLENHRTALLVPPGDPSALAAAMERLAADPALRHRLGASAREAAKAKHTWIRNAERILDLARFL